MGRRILIADGNADSAESLALLLGLFGHQTATAYSGPQTLERAAAFHPDAVFLSLHLPQINGYEVCRRLNSDGGGPRLFVALTGDGSERVRRDCLDAGFHHHLLKPASPDAIVALLKQDELESSSGFSSQGESRQVSSRTPPETAMLT